MAKTAMTDSERRELEQLITDFLEQAVSDEYAHTILESECDDGNTLLEYRSERTRHVSLGRRTALQ